VILWRNSQQEWNAALDVLQAGTADAVPTLPRVAFLDGDEVVWQNVRPCSAQSCKATAP
jgi:hypothetical protein